MPKETELEFQGGCPGIIESYTDYLPPFNIKAAVTRMLDAMPAERLIGLRAVVLTNKASLSRKQRRSVMHTARKRKVRIDNVTGQYHPHWGSEQAWIELFVDEILRVWQKRWLLKVPLWRDILISNVLYHEIGHHIHSTSRPEFRERETVADEWRDRLQGRYLRRRYPWLLLIVYPIKAAGRMLGWTTRLLRRAHRP